MLREEFLVPFGISQNALAMKIRVPATRIGDIIHGKRSITPDTALRLARFFGNSPEFWMNLQTAHDLTRARAEMPGKEMPEKEMRKKPVRPVAKSRARNLRAQGAD